MKHILCAGTSPEPDSVELNNRVLVRRAAAEGMVLLKNDGMLPVMDKRIALYGSGARRTVAGGTGSGAMHERYDVGIEQGLLDAGFEITTKEWLNRYDDFYDASYRSWKEHIEDLVKDMRNPMQILGTRIANDFVYPTGIPVEKNDLQDGVKDCFYVLARQGGEGHDRKDVRADYELDDLEMENLRKICGYYENVCVVINCGGILDCEFLDELPVKALFFIGQSGEEGGHAFADLVSGRQNPSGKLSDTWAMHYCDVPSAGIFADEGGDPTVQDYREGIYVGYRYFDSFGIKPRFRFGFGLSYTAFDIHTSHVFQKGENLEIEASVRNTGSVSGREVLQVYATVPFGKDGNEYQRLIGFMKTKELAAGEKEDCFISVPLKKLAVYQEGTSSYILSCGTYILRIGNGSGNTQPITCFTLKEDVTTEVCTKICPLRPELEEMIPPARKRENLTGVPEIDIDPASIGKIVHEYIALPVYPDVSVQEKIESMSVHDLAAITVGNTLFGRDPYVCAVGASGNTNSGLLDSCGIPNIVLSDGPAGLNLTAEIVETSDGEIKSTAMYPQYDFGFFGKMLRSRLGKPEDGTMHYQYATALPCSTVLAQTWNTDLLREIGTGVGAEMEKFGVTVWLAPGMNIHRNPLCGRVFEYYSEDPYLSGALAAALTEGVQSHPGKFVSLKHFCANNSEAKRDHSSSNMTEKTLREIYLKGFETAVEKCMPGTIMASYNKINGAYSTNNYDTLVKVLRNEWGFDGVVMSDWNATSKKSDTADILKAASCGCDLTMPGEDGQIEDIVKGIEAGAVAVDDVKRSAGRVLALIRRNTAAECR